MRLIHFDEPRIEHAVNRHHNGVGIGQRIDMLHCRLPTIWETRLSRYSVT
jgi:hypothetical protein